MDPHCPKYSFCKYSAMRVTLQDFNPKLSDFGVARYGPLDDQSHVTTRIHGTRGYFAPEYFTTGIYFSLSF